MATPQTRNILSVFRNSFPDTVIASYLRGGSLLPQLHDEQLIHAFLQLLSEVTVEGVLAEGLVDHEDGVPHDVPPPAVVGQDGGLVVRQVVARWR